MDRPYWRTIKRIALLVSIVGGLVAIGANHDRGILHVP